MEHYNITEQFDTEVTTSFIGFPIQPTARQRRSYPTFYGTLSALTIYADTLSGAKSFTVRLSEDLDGDKMIVGDTQVGLCLGVTTATMTSSIIQIEIDVAGAWPSKVWIKTDAGTVNVREVKLTWRV